MRERAKRRACFFKRKKGKCVKNRSSFCHAVVPPALLCLSPSPPLTAFVSLPPIPLPLSPPHVSLICFPSKSSSYFIPFPVNAVSFCVCVCLCVCVCKPSCCLSLSLSDVQQLLEGSFSLPLKHTHTHALSLLSYAPALTYFPNAPFLAPSHFFQFSPRVSRPVFSLY